MYINDRGQKVFVGDELKKLLPRDNLRRLLERRSLHYKTTFQGLPISVENRKGSIRRGVDDDGSPWETKMKLPYGYIRGTEGADGDHLDMFMGPNEDAAFAYVIHCNTSDGVKFDEDKIMLGFSTADAAKRVFKQHYDDDSFFGGIERIPMWKFHDLAFVKKITTKKIKESREGASLQVPEDTLGVAGVGGRGTDQQMKKAILGKNIMPNPEVRESMMEGGPGSGRHKLFHGTTEENARNILKNGMRGTPSHYVSKTRQQAKEYAKFKAGKGKVAVVVLNNPPGKKGFKPDDYFDSNDPKNTLVTYHDVDPKHISHVELYDRGGKKTIITKDDVKNDKSLKPPPRSEDSDTDKYLRKKYPHWFQESSEGGPGSGRHAGLEQRVDSLVKSIQITKDPLGKKVLARRLENLRDEIQKKMGESKEMGVVGMKWGTANAKEQPARAAALKHGYSADDKTPGLFHKDGDTVVTHNDGRWSHTSLDAGTTRGQGAVDLHYHLKGQQRESREGGPGSGPKEHIEKAGGEYKGEMHGLHWFNDPKTRSTLAMKSEQITSPEAVRAHMAKSRKSFGIEESREHGVKGMKWGVRHARKDANTGKGATQGGKPGKSPLPASKRDLANDPRTLSMMQVEHKGQQQLNKVSQQQQQAKQQGKQEQPNALHEHALEALKDLGWEVLKMGAGFTGLGGAVNALQSIVRSPAGKKLFMKTDEGGNHTLSKGKQGGVPAGHRTRASMESRIKGFMREAKVYYARPLGRYETDAEESDLDLIEEAEPDSDIDYPATRRHAELGMGHFHNKIDKADKVVLKAARKNRLTAGVFSEARHALKKGKPVYAIHQGKLRRVKNVEALDHPNKSGHFGKIIWKRTKRK